METFTSQEKETNDYSQKYQVMNVQQAQTSFIQSQSSLIERYSVILYITKKQGDFVTVLKNYQCDLNVTI